MGWMVQVDLRQYIYELMVSTGGCASAGYPIASCKIYSDKSYAFLEFRSVEEASNCMAFDGVAFQGLLLAGAPAFGQCSGFCHLPFDCNRIWPSEKCRPASFMVSRTPANISREPHPEPLYPCIAGMAMKWSIASLPISRNRSDCILLLSHSALRACLPECGLHALHRGFQPCVLASVILGFNVVWYLYPVCYTRHDFL